MKGRSHILVAVALLALAGVMVAFAKLGDYSPDGHAAGNAGPGIAALLSGNVDRFFSVQPLMGLFSIVLRLPFAGLADALGGGTEAVYRAGSFGCLLGPVALGLQLFRMMQARGRSLPAALLLSGLCVANPATLAGLRIGHPEESLAAALVVLAVLVARERPVVAGVLTGLAIGTKQWALAALPVVLMLAARRRPALILAAGAVAACLLVPGPLVDRGAATDARREVLDTHAVNVVSAWWPLARDRRAGGTVTGHVLPGGLTRTDVAAAVVLVALLLSLELARRGGFEGDGATERALALLGLILLLRCALDPGNLEYYGVGPLLALCAWEGLARAGPPLITPLAMVANWALFGPITGLDDTRITIAFLGLNLCFGLYLALASFAPGRLQRPAAAQL